MTTDTKAAWRRRALRAEHELETLRRIRQFEHKQELQMSRVDAAQAIALREIQDTRAAISQAQACQTEGVHMRGLTTGILRAAYYDQMGEMEDLKHELEQAQGGKAGEAIPGVVLMRDGSGPALVKRGTEHKHDGDRLYTGPAPGVPEDVVRDAERYRWLRELPNANSLNVSYVGTDLDNVIDAAMLAAAPAQKDTP